MVLSRTETHLLYFLFGRTISIMGALNQSWKPMSVKSFYIPIINQQYPFQSISSQHFPSLIFEYLSPKYKWFWWSKSCVKLNLVTKVKRKLASHFSFNFLKFFISQFLLPISKIKLKWQNIDIITNKSNDMRFCLCLQKNASCIKSIVKIFYFCCFTGMD